eukprot:jgi/Botrbrau1/6391/Bobra.49_1s0009.1
MLRESLAILGFTDMFSGRVDRIIGRPASSLSRNPSRIVTTCYLVLLNVSLLHLPSLFRCLPSHVHTTA